MVDREKLAQRLMATFLEELRDHVATLNRELLALEAGPTAEHRAEIFKVLFRAAHSLKGAARAVNVDLLERVCHRLEDILDASRSQSIEFTPKLFALLFKSIDGIDDAGTQLRQSKDLTGSRLVDLLPELEEEATIARDAKKGKPPNPPRVVQAPSASETPEEGSTTSEKSAVPQQPAESVPKAKSAPPKRMTTSTVRVASDKLDALLAQTGELLVARRRVEQHSKDINSLRQELVSCKANWQAIERPIRRIRQSLETSPHAQELKQILAAIDHGRELVATLDRELEDAAIDMAADSTILNRACTALEGEVYRVRMLPFVEACSGLERAIRDIARSTDKQVKLVIVGEDVEIDRGILDALKDPLLHLVRNA
ncbi:MAG: Hpt domain-containing protein, partial [Planctomycetota bacterium]